MNKRANSPTMLEGTNEFALEKITSFNVPSGDTSGLESSIGGSPSAGGLVCSKNRHAADSLEKYCGP